MNWRKGTIYVLLAALLSLPHLAQAASRDQYGRYHALVIGNDDYAHLPKLNTAVSDAIATAGLLRSKYDFDVTLLLNATQAQTLNFVDWLKSELTAKDRLLIYYAGHGGIDRKTDTGYWLPIDAKPDDKTNWIANESITKLLRAMAARHVIVIADSIFSGTQTRAAELAAQSGVGRDEWIRRMAKTRARTALVSGGLKPVTGTGGGGHSVFANAFLSALRDNNEVLDGQSLFQRLRGRLAVKADQTPRYGTIRRAAHEGGDFLFVPRMLAAEAEAKPAVSPVDSNKAELLFWETIKDSQDAESYQAYLEQYPTGSFAVLARVRLKKLKSSQTASLEPAIVLEPIEGMFVAVRNANVRITPNVNAEKVVTLRKGREIYVPGKVTGKNWLAVDRDGKRLGYVFSNLLQDREVFEAARNEEVAKGKQKAERQAREQAQNRESAAWKMVAASGSAAALRIYLQQYPDGANASLARFRLADLEASEGNETRKLTMRQPKPATKTANPSRFDGNWTAMLDDCGVSSFGEPISYDFDLRITSGRYHIKATANQGFIGSGETQEMSGPIVADGRIRVAVPFKAILPEDPNLEIILRPGDGRARLLFDKCRISLTAKP